MVPCEPALQVVLEGGARSRGGAGRAYRRRDRRYSKADAKTFVEVTHRLHRLAGHLQGFFLEEPPDLYATGWGKVKEGKRAYTRLKGLGGDELTDLVRFTTGSLGEFVDRWFESEEVKRLYLANNVYGMHAPPYRPGTAIGLMFHMLSGGEHEVQGFNGHVIGGMGSITRAMAAAATEAGAGSGRSPVSRISTRDGRAVGVVLDDGTEIVARVWSRTLTRSTFLGMLEEGTCRGTSATTSPRSRWPARARR